MKGKFITIEGSDGSGKTTQTALLQAYFEKNACPAPFTGVLFTREPGGTAIGETIRQVILDIKNREMADVTEALLYAAARAQHVAEKVVPALEAGYLVFCDRFVDSSVAYQGFGRQLGKERVLTMNEYAVEQVPIHRTIYLDLPPEKGIFRKKGQRALDRLEEQDLAFHKRVYAGYEWLLEREPGRFRRIDADAPADAVHQRVLAALEDIL